MTTLEQLKPGEFARIVSINTGQSLKHKLSSKGVIEGCLLRVISSHYHIVIDTNKKIFAIGHEIAEKIRIIRIKIII